MSLTATTTTLPGSIYPVVRASAALMLMTFAGCGMYAAIIVLEPVTVEFGIGRGTGALPYTMFMIGFAVGSVVMGGVADRIGIMIPALIGGVCQPIGFMIASQSQSLWPFCISLAVFGGFLGTAVSFGPLVSDISHWFTTRRGLAVGIVISGTYIAGAIWPPIIQTWIDSHGWRETFTMLAVVTGAGMLPLALVLYRKAPLHDHPKESGTDAMTTQPLGMSRGNLQVCLCVAGVGCCVAMSMPQVHIVPYALDLGFKPIHGAQMLAMMLGFGIISRITSGWVSDRIGGLKTLMLGSMMQALVLSAFMFADTLTALYITSAAFGLAQGGIVPSYTIIIRRYFPPGQSGTRIGMTFFSTICGMALGGWMAGVLYDLSGSYTLSFINAIGFNVLNLGIAVLLLGRSQYEGELQSAAV